MCWWLYSTCNSGISYAVDFIKYLCCWYIMWWWICQIPTTLISQNVMLIKQMYEISVLKAVLEVCWESVCCLVYLPACRGSLMNLEQALNVLREKIVMKSVSWKSQIFDFLVSHQLSVSYIADTGRRPCNSAGLPACQICNRAGWRCWSKRSCQVWDRKSLTLSWPHSYQLHWQCSICVGKFQKQGMYSLCTIFSKHCVYLQVTLTMSST